MNSNFRFTMFIAVLLISISTNSFAQFSRQQAINKVLNEIVVADTGHINVWSAMEIKNYQDTIGLIFNSVLECPYNYNWVFFVDDYPSAGWAHPCRYIFIDSISGGYQIMNEEQYPACFGLQGSDEYEIVMQVDVPDPVVLPPGQIPQAVVSAPNDHLFAVIIITQDWQSKDLDPNRFWYDASLIYNTLIEKGYKDENIFVHYGNGSSSNGSDFNGGDEDVHIDYDASESRILETFDNLAGNSTSDNLIPILSPTDQLFVFIDGHGYEGSGHSILFCDYNDSDLYDSELAEHVEDINCAQMVFLIQPCFSGHFATELTDYDTYNNVACKNRVVHTATTIDMWSSSEYYLTQNR